LRNTEQQRFGGRERARTIDEPWRWADEERRNPERSLMQGEVRESDMRSQR
jgi:hypothetical protein